MDRYGLFFIRMVMITLGYAAAAVTAGVSLALLTKFITPQQAGYLADSGFDFGLLIGAVALGSLAGYVAFVPAMLVILVAEVAKRRDWLFYALAGGAIAAAAPLLIALFTGPDRGAPTDFALMSLAAGMIGGTAYWLIAGRGAGNWLPSAREDTETGSPPVLNDLHRED